MSKIVVEAWVPVPTDKVFAFFSDPHNLPRLMPAHLSAKIEDMRLVPPNSGAVGQSGWFSAPTGSPLAGPGSEIRISFRPVPFLPFRQLWVAEIVEYVTDSYFRDIQKEGPMRSWSHTHQFTTELRDGVAGTRVRDIVNYTLPLGSLGRLADTIFVRNMLLGTFRSRQRTLATLLR